MAKSSEEIGALGSILDLLQSLDEKSRERLLSTVDAFFGRSPGGRPAFDSRVESAPLREAAGKSYSAVEFSQHSAPSPKQFLLEKQPRTDVERVACLAFYLAHFRDTPQFKTFDISKLNSEAAQMKLSNTAYAVSNAKAAGYIASVGKGACQISAAGERFVIALPDRDRAKIDMAAATLGRSAKRRQRGRKR